jgi:hypothetical protein
VPAEDPAAADVPAAAGSAAAAADLPAGSSCCCSTFSVGRSATRSPGSLAVSVLPSFRPTAEVGWAHIYQVGCFICRAVIVCLLLTVRAVKFVCAALATPFWQWPFTLDEAHLGSPCRRNGFQSGRRCLAGHTPCAGACLSQTCGLSCCRVGIVQQLPPQGS